jgi:hypothetical protein
MITEERQQELIGYLFPIIGIGLSIGAIASGIWTYRFIQMASRAEGAIVNVDLGRAHPAIQFLPAGESQPVKFTGSGWINYGVGDKVNVLYIKDSTIPAGYNYSVDTPGSLWFGTGIMTLLGTAFSIVGWQTRRSIAANKLKRSRYK